jgi:hypothetical protein
MFAASIVAISTPSLAADTCAYLIGEVNGGMVATPAILIITPDVSAVVTPAQVVVDPTNQDILGYQLSTPGQSVDTPGYSVYQEGEQEEVESYEACLDDLNIGEYRCVNHGVVTPAVPIFVPANYLEIPGVLTTTPGATFTIAHQQVTVPAFIVDLPGHSIVVPAIDETIDPITVETPEQSIVVNFAVPWVVPYLEPVAVDGNEIVDGAANPPTP